MKGYFHIKSAGFQCVDFNLQQGFFEVDTLNFRYDIEKVLVEHMETIKLNGLSISQTHAPYYFLDRHIKNFQDFDRYMSCLFESVEITAALGVKYMVLHPFFLTKDLLGLISQFELNLTYIKKLATFAQKKNVFIAVENLFYDFCSDPYSHINLINSLKCSNVVACFDTGHAFISEGLNMNSHAAKLKDLLRVVHIHDNYGHRDEHLRIGNGKIAWAEILEIFLKNAELKTLSLELSGVYKFCPVENIPVELISDFNNFSNILNEVGKNVYDCT